MKSKKIKKLLKSIIALVLVFCMTSSFIVESSALSFQLPKPISNIISSVTSFLSTVFKSKESNSNDSVLSETRQMKGNEVTFRVENYGEGEFYLKFSGNPNLESIAIKSEGKGEGYFTDAFFAKTGKKITGIEYGSNPVYFRATSKSNGYVTDSYKSNYRKFSLISKKTYTIIVTNYDLYDDTDYKVTIYVKNASLVTEVKNQQVNSANYVNSADSNVYFQNPEISTSSTGTSVNMKTNIYNPSLKFLSSYGVTVSNSSGNTKSGTNSQKISYNTSLNNLYPNRTYSAYLYAKTSGGTYQSGNFYFKTPKVKPLKTSITSVKTIDYRDGNTELNSSELGVGDSVRVRWNASQYDPDYYTISINGVEQSNKIYGTQTVVRLTKTGENTISVRAHNNIGSSDWSETKTATVHPDVDVTFTVDGELYQNNTLTWNHDLNDLPETPIMAGRAFKGWYYAVYNEETEQTDEKIAYFKNIKSDSDFYAGYNLNKYTVKFLDESGKTVISEQTVEYGCAAAEPDEATVSQYIESGKTFIGWNKKIDNIIENTEVKAVTDASNQNIKVKITDAEAVKGDNNYTVTCKVTNLTNSDVKHGRVVVALKKDNGQLAGLSESAAFFLKANYTDVVSGDKVINSEDIKIVVPITDEKFITEGSSYTDIDAATVSIYVINDYDAAVPISQNVDDIVITSDSPWSNWTDNYAAENDVAYTTTDSDGNDVTAYTAEARLRYRSQNYIYTTTTSEAEVDKLTTDEGWALDEEKTYKDTGSGTWSKTKPSGTVNVDYAEKTVTDKAAYYSYKAYRYYNTSAGCTYANYCANPSGGKWYYTTTTSPLTYYKSYDGWNGYKDSSGNLWFSNTSSKTDPKVAAVTHKEYRAFDTVYTLAKWGEFNDWTIVSTSVPHVKSAAIDKTTGKVIFTLADGTTADSGLTLPVSKTVNYNFAIDYRYNDRVLNKSTVTAKDESDSVLRNDYTSGYLGEDLAGKQATLIVYKYDEIADWTIEHIDQTIIDEDGNYCFDSYRLRQEPSQQTGDMTVVIGVEGAEEATYCGTIKAPDPTYTVKYQYFDADGNPVPISVTLPDGSTVTEQSVTEGEDAVVPEAPEIEGYTFSHWNYCSTNVKQDLVINAVYEKNEYTVFWVDFVSDNYYVQQYNHGDKLVPPAELTDTDTMTANGWDYDASEPVTSNMVITAKYDYTTFTVDIYDYDMNIIDTQEVRAGESPNMPDTDDFDYYDNEHVLFGFEAGETLEDALSGSSDETSETQTGDANAETTDSEVSTVEEYRVYSNCVIVPEFEFTDTCAAPTANVETGTYTASKSVTLSCSTADSVIYYTLDGTDPSESSTAVRYTGPFTVSKSSMLRCYASSLNMNDSSETVKYYAINTGSDKDYILKIADAYGTLETQIVDSGSLVTSDLLADYEGYTFAGVYRDADLTNVWNLASDKISADTTLYVKFNANTYTVNFVDYDGKMTSQTVEYSDSAVPPENLTRDGYVFTGWDSYDYEYVTEDMDINAQYVPEDEYVDVTFSASVYSTMVGSSTPLSATAVSSSGDTSDIIWSSSDESVAVVDEDGNAYGLSEGTVTITATAEDSGAKAECTLIVGTNPSQTLYLTSLSKVKTDSEGYLRNITITRNTDGTNTAMTASEVKAQFANSSSIKIYNADGELIGDDEPVGTGSVVKLYNGTTVVDEMSIIVTGDVDGDGYVSNRDAAYISRFMVNKESPDTMQLYAMNVNGDKYVNNKDAALISRYLVNKESF